MVLNDKEIEDLVNSDNMITEFDGNNLANCGYTFRVGQIYEPETGKQLLSQTTPGYVIAPNGTAIIMTKERVKIPDDLCANYSPLFRLAKEGILLLNSSLVEPLYDGHLSCFFVNLSSQDYVFTMDDDIAKLVFSKLTASPKNPKSLIITDQEYKNTLFKQATKFHSSFLNVKKIEETLKEKTASELLNTKKAINDSLKIGGFLVAFLLLWSTLEPLISKWIWGRSPVIDAKTDILEKQILRDATFKQGTTDLLKDLLDKERLLLTRDSLNQIELRKLRLKVDSLDKRL